MLEVVCNDRLGKKVRVKCNEDDTVGDLKKVSRRPYRRPRTITPSSHRTRTPTLTCPHPTANAPLSAHSGADRYAS
jgi:hypothetical protein